MALPPTQQELRRTACDLAQIGAAEALRWLGKVSVARKADQTPVTDADHAAQEAILYHLSHRYPSHSIIVEEEIARPNRHSNLVGSEYCWIVDPIDGTRNFARGVRVFAVSIAVLHDGRPVAGAIYDATSGLIYSASRDEGAFQGDDPMRLANEFVAADATIALSSFRKRTTPPYVRSWMERFLFRNHGAVALHLAWVAAGLLEAAFSVECKLWDIAAGSLLVEAAGGIVTGPTGEPLWPINVESYQGEDLPTLAGMPAMHAALLNMAPPS